MSVLRILSLLILLLLNTDGEYQVRINELNAENNKNNDMEFLKLIKIGCDVREMSSLKNYLLIIVNELADLFELPSVVLSADLCNFSIASGSEFFVIGTRNNEYKPNLSFTSEKVMYRKKRTKTRIQNEFYHKENYKLLDIIENGNIYSMAVFLLKLHSIDQIANKQQFI